MDRRGQAQRLGLLLLIPALLAGLAWAAHFKKSDEARLTELVASLARPDDLVFVAGPYRLAPAGQGGAKIRYVDSCDIRFFESGVDVDAVVDGKTQSLHLPPPAGRILLLSGAGNTGTILGRVSRVRSDAVQVTIIHPLAVQAGGWDLLQLFASMRVARKGPDAETICPLRGDTFDCGGESWRSVKIVSLSFGGKLEPCVFAHPISPGALELSLYLPVDTHALVIEGGIDDPGALFPQGAPVTMTIATQERILAEAIFENRPGLVVKRFDFSPPVARGAKITLSVTSPNQDTRHFCFKAAGNPAVEEGATGDVSRETL